MRDHTLRMGLVMPWTAAFGTEYPASFWCAGKPDIDPEAGIIKIEFHGWQSVEAYNQELPSIPGAKKLYQFDGTRYFDVIAMPCSLGPGAPVVAEMVNLANQLAMAEKDVVGPDGPISFFETAIPAS